MFPDLSSQTSDRKYSMSTELSTQLAILRQRLEEAQAINHWKPEPGETLLGVLRGLKPAQGPFGEGHMLIVETEGGELWSKIRCPWSMPPTCCEP
jgi:hypothetical protein